MNKIAVLTWPETADVVVAVNGRKVYVEDRNEAESYNNLVRARELATNLSIALGCGVDHFKVPEEADERVGHDEAVRLYAQTHGPFDTPARSWWVQHDPDTKDEALQIEVSGQPAEVAAAVKNWGELDGVTKDGRPVTDYMTEARLSEVVHGGQKVMDLDNGRLFYGVT